MTDTTQHHTQQMIEVQPINSFADIPTEIWVAMGIQLVLIALFFWLFWKLVSKILPLLIERLVRRSKADAANSSEGGAQ